MAKYWIYVLVDISIGISDRHARPVSLYDAGMYGLYDGQTQLLRYSRPVLDAASERNTERKKAINQING